MISIVESIIGYLRAGVLGATGGISPALSTMYDLEKIKELKKRIKENKKMTTAEKKEQEEKELDRDTFHTIASTIPIVGSIPALLTYKRRVDLENKLKNKS